MNVLFVCKYNRFRSKVAEAYFNKIKKSNNLVCKSAGEKRHVEIGEILLRFYKEVGLNVNKNFANVSNDLLNWADLVIIVADNVDLKPFGHIAKEVRTWDVQDAEETDIIDRRRAVDEIFKKVELLVRELEGRLK